MTISPITLRRTTALCSGGLALLAALGALSAPDAQAATYPTFHTVGSNVNMRACDSATQCGVTYTIPKKGTAVSVVCYRRGSSVDGDTIWYDAFVTGKGSGSVAGYWLDTGADPSPKVSACGPTGP